MSEMLRHFTHITIPAEIWLNKNISMQAKALWAELRSLHCPNAGGCFASEEYLCEFMNLKRSRLHEVFRELKDNNLMESTFNGRQSIRRAIVPNVENYINISPDSSYPENRTPAIRFSGHPSYIENKVLEESNNTPPTPEGNPAIAGGECVPSPTVVVQEPPALPKPEKSKPPIPKPGGSKKELHLDCVLLTPDEFAKLVELYGQEVLDWLLEELNTYVGASGKKYASHYHVLQKRGWVYKRYCESKASVKVGYQRSGKLVIEADKLVQPSEIQRYKVNISDEERAKFFADREKALKGAKPK